MYIDTETTPPRAAPRAVQVSYNCPTECSGLIVRGNGAADAGGITVFGSMLHMHRTGIAMQTTQMRDGQVGPPPPPPPLWLIRARCFGVG